MDSALTAASLAVLVGAVYLIILRFMDMNEREPLWTLILALFAGVVGALLTRTVIGGRVLVLEPILGPIAQETAIFLMLGLVIALFGGIAGARGYSEFQGPMDGIVYGASVGLGFAVGYAFLQGLVPVASPQPTSAFGTLWATALLGLSLGLFGAIVGLGYGFARLQRSTGAKVVAALVGLAAGILVHIGYELLTGGDDLEGGSSAMSWIALLLPLVLVIAVGIYAIGRERRAIREELREEAAAGVVTDDELRLLSGFGARQSAYSKRFFKGDFDGWLALRALHARQVQLALAKSRQRRVGDAESANEVQALRASVAVAREHAVRTEG